MQQRTRGCWVSAAASTGDKNSTVGAMDKGMSCKRHTDCFPAADRVFQQMSLSSRVRLSHPRDLS
jgi:hypothetical protein